MSHEQADELAMFRKSHSEYRIRVNKADGTAYDLSLLDLLIIAKQKKTDADEDAVFQLTNLESSAIVLDPEVEDNNELLITIESEDTQSLPPTKDTTLHCELIVTSDQRKTLGRFTLPVFASLLQA